MQITFDPYDPAQVALVRSTLDLMDAANAMETVLGQPAQTTYFPSDDRPARVEKTTNTLIAEEIKAMQKPRPEKATLEQVRKALEAYAQKFGIGKGFELLAKFGASRAGDLKEEQYDAFLVDATAPFKQEG